MALNAGTRARLITELENELADHERQVEELRAAISVIRRLTVSDESENERPKKKLKPEQPLALPLMTIPQGVRYVLMEGRAPMKARAIADRMLALGFRYDKTASKLRASIGSTVDRKARAGDTFAKMGKGLYALREWQQNSNVTPAIEHRSANLVE